MKISNSDIRSIQEFADSHDGEYPVTCIQLKRLLAERAQLVAIANAADEYRAAAYSDDGNSLARGDRHARAEVALRARLDDYFGPAPGKDEK